MSESTTTRIADLTIAELEAVIERVVSRVLEQQHTVHPRWLNENAPAEDTRTLDQVLEDIERHRWTPPPGSPSTLEMIREDRDSL